MSDGGRSLGTSRILPFSRSQIYGAFSSPDLLAKWWGPNGFTNTFEAFEFCTGGRWTFVMHGPDGKDYFNESIFEELVPNTMVVIRHDCQPYFTLTVSLEYASGGTHLVWEQAFEDAQTAQAVKQMVGAANEENIDRLTRVLAESANC